MTFVGCTDWQDMQTRTGFAMVEPGSLVVAHVSVEHRGQLALMAVWREGANYRFLECMPERGEDIGADLYDEEGAFNVMMSRAVGSIVASAASRVSRGHTEGHHEVCRLLFAEARVIAERLGIRIGWAVESTSGSYEATYTHTLAVYEDLSLALAHKKAAALSELLRDETDEFWEGPPSMRIDWIPMRNSLPKNLAVLASGEIAVPLRPELSIRGPTIESPSVGTVIVPERGVVTFIGTDAASSSSYFFAAQPRSKVTCEVQEKADRWNPHPYPNPIEGNAVRWRFSYGWDPNDTCEEFAHVSGPDAVALASELAALVVQASGARAKGAKERAEREASESL